MICRRLNRLLFSLCYSWRQNYLLDTLIISRDGAVLISRYYELLFFVFAFVFSFLPENYSVESDISSILVMFLYSVMESTIYFFGNYLACVL